MSGINRVNIKMMHIGQYQGNSVFTPDGSQHLPLKGRFDEK